MANYLMKVTVTDSSQLEELMDEAAYADFCAASH